MGPPDEDYGLGGNGQLDISIFYLVVVQAVLICRLEKLGMSLRIGQTRGILNHRTIHQLMGQHPRQQADSSCSYNPVSTAISKAGLEEVETYISHFQTTIVQLITTRPIMDLCMKVERLPGA